MPLTFAQKSAVRRHLDYPVAGLLKSSPAGGSLASAFAGYRFFQTYGRLEWKMNNLNADEEARLLGVAYGAIALIGPNPNVGDTVGITISGGGLVNAQTISATAQARDAPANLILRLAANAASNTAMQAAGILALSPFGSGPFNQNEMPLAELAFEGPSPFTLANATGSGLLVPQITATGTYLSPSTSLDGTTTIYGYLPILDGLEGAWASGSQNLDTQRAGPWHARSNEIGQRLSLYQNWQIRLSRFLEIPVYNGTPEPGRQRYVSTGRHM